MDLFAMIEAGFPADKKEQCRKVASTIGIKTISHYPLGFCDGYNSENELYALSDGTMIRIPYRVYFCENDTAYDGMNVEEKLICDCVFTRSSNGFLRQKHLRRILETEIPEWCMPYLLRLSAEYVVEIIDCIYCALLSGDHAAIQAFCLQNSALLKRSFQRMTSYWNEYYKQQYPVFHDYVGFKLYKHIFAPHLNLERL